MRVIPSGRVVAEQVIRATERSMARAAAGVRQDLGHGLTTLATIASLAPFVGILGTVSGILFDTFTGLGTEKTTAMAAVFEALAHACVPAALGLLLGLQSLWCYRYFRVRLAEFEFEMKNVSVALMNEFALRRAQFSPASPIDSLPFLEQYSFTASEDHELRRRCTLWGVTLLTMAWCIQIAWYFEIDSLSLAPAAYAACRSVLITLGCSYLVAYAVWVDFLHRKSAALPLVSASLCLFWSVAGRFVSLLS